MSLDSLASGWAKALSVDRKHFNMFFERMMDGFAYHKIVLDKSGKPVDYVFLEVNNAFEKLTGLKREKIIGKKVTEVLKGIESDPADWIGRYGKVALSCESTQFESFNEALGKWFNVSAYCPEKGYFVALFEDITERKKAENELKSTFSRFYGSLSSLHGAILLVSDDGHVEFANQAFIEYFNLKESPEQLKGLTADETVRKIKDAYLNPEKELKRISEIVAAGKPVFGEEVVLIGGRTCLRDFIPLRVADGQGSFSRLWHHTDITDIKKAETAVIQSEQRWATTLSSIGDAVIATDTEGKITFMNNVSEEVTGWLLAEAMGEPIGKVFKIINEKTRKDVENPVEKVLQKGCVVGLANHTLLIRKNGVEISIDDSGAPITTSDGKTTGVVLVFRDITERKIITDKLATQASMIANANDAIIGYNPEMQVTFWNKRAQQLYGYTEEEAMGKTGTSLLKPSCETVSREELVKALETKGHIETESIRQDKKGQKLNIEAHVILLKNEFGKPAGYVSVDRDITERKLNEEKLLKLNRTLRAISDSNQVLMRATDETLFLNQACKIIVEDCGYKMVWVGLAEDDPAKTVRPVAYAGFDAGYIKSLKVTWAETERGQGPTGRAIRTGKIQFCNDMRTNPAFKPWREEALKRGYASSIALPLISENKVLGALMLYSTEPNVSSNDEVKLLSELAGDFAHGVNMLRLRKEKELAEAQIQRQAYLIDLSPDAIIVRKFDGTITFWSKGAEKLYGWTKEEAIGKSTHVLLKTKFPESFEKITDKLEKFKHWTGELIHKTKSGKEVTVQSWWLAEKTERGKITSILESNVDLTERKAAEKEIERLASFPLLNPTPVVEINSKGNVTFANPATKTLFPDLEVLGLRHVFFSDWEAVNKYFDSHSTNCFGRELKIGDHWYHQQLYLVPNTHLTRIYATDVDEQKQAEEARARAQIKLEENAILLEEYANQMEELAEHRAKQLKDAERLAGIGQTAGMVGHDIRNPLQAITGDMYLIGEEAKEMPEGDSKQAIMESIESINQNIVYINKIVSDLQDYTRTLKPNIQDVNLSEIIQETIATIYIPKNIEVHTLIQQGAKPIKTDTAYLRRILTNLVTNGVQAMQDGGKLTIKGTQRSKTTIITVQDTGVGIPKDVKDKMFTPLFTTKSKGQGLGLAVVKRLVEALGGTVKFESEENRGTKFMVELPKQQ